MKTRLIVALAGLTLCFGAQANDAASVHATNAWIRVLPGTLPAGGYVDFANDSDHTLKIVDTDSPAYGHAMLHRSSTDGGMGRMEMLKSVDLPAKSTTKFAPGGYHVMLMDAGKPVKAGDTVVVNFHLADGSVLPVNFVARPANANGPKD
ncbi:hypothetical protein EC912_11237 [Luteibacter rhizovicinus]|uniref:Copper(I)-binding protein n=1 Tax=Luteibacter rhizovicinus TaxID=242606 RepID=A0A4R3YGX9_9GAMM|nr:copper chaperone PCu(A)C [Luteibacter rhizovicinus]TCV91291.1 hypothetical protein EC912_11237 [Luteibacter rhizovicinus]